jgi:hypothetical protein
MGTYHYSSAIGEVFSSFFPDGFDGTETDEIAIDDVQLVPSSFSGKTA